jgi:hypothetical protein
MRLALLLATAAILIRDPTGKWAGDPLQPWFESLRNKVGKYCCTEADGHPLDEGEWDMISAPLPYTPHPRTFATLSPGKRTSQPSATNSTSCAPG